MSPPQLPPVAGFRFAAAASGMRYEGRPDVGLILADRPSPWAARLTRSSAAGAPVEIVRELREAGYGDRPRPVRAILVNAGLANAGTGEAGVEDAREITGELAERLGIEPHEVLPASTGTIGIRLPLDRFRDALPALVDDLSPDGAGRVARAMMTSDSRPKAASARCEIDGQEVTLVGVAKGSGMIAPDMATLLAFLVTDAAATPAFLDQALGEAVEGSFNALTVDGDMSTSDMALLVASGAAATIGAPALDGGHPDAPVFRRALAELTVDLTRQLARDGEGSGKLVTVEVTGAADRDQARRAARAVATSSLTRAALSGGRVAWGYLVASLGAAGARFRVEDLAVRYGDALLVSGGLDQGPELEEAARRHLAGDDVRLAIDLGAGDGAFTYYTCDLTEEYVRGNATTGTPGKPKSSRA